jgi:phytoene dehydrogenase-like protein
MGPAFWDSEGCILVNFLEKRETINAARYVQMLNKLREKRPKKKTVILQLDNVGPHTTRLTFRQFKRTAGNCSPIHPTVRISPPSDYHLFGPLKHHLRGHHYETDEAVQEAVRSWLRGAGTDFYRRNIFKILQRWQKCIDRDGNFGGK